MLQRLISRYARTKTGALRRRLSRRAPRRRLAVDRLEQRAMLSGVVTIGDSWAWLIAANAPGSAPPASGFNDSLGIVLNAFHPGVTHYNESFGGGTAAQHVAELYTPTGIISRINAHPDADIVWLSSGGNDMLLGQFGGGFYVNNPNNPTVYANIQNNVQTLVDAILAVRSDIQVVIEGYDYLNIWDTVSGSTGDTVRLNLGVIKSGNTIVDGLQNLAVNDGFKAAEAGKTAIANASRRVAHIDNFGLNNTAGGYTGYFGSFPAGTSYPPELYPYLPTPANRMNTGDPIHLNNLGYGTLALYAEQQFLASALSPAQLALSATSLDFGNVRFGTSASLSTTASNVGPNYTKVKNLTFAAAAGDFGGGGQSFDPLFNDPTLGSDTAAVGYSYTPTSRGADAASVTISFASGSTNLDLSGQGVGPDFDSAAAITLPTFMQGNPAVGAPLDVSNATSDGDLGGLTDLTLLSAAITGPDAARFSLSGFTPGAVIAAGGTLHLAVAFDEAGAAPGTYSATLSLATDQGAALGGPGQQFDIPLSVTVLIPGDATADGLVDGSDYTVWADHYQQTTGAGYSVGDFNGDGQVNGGDYTIWADHYAPPPAPALAPSLSQKSPSASDPAPETVAGAASKKVELARPSNNSPAALADHVFARSGTSWRPRVPAAALASARIAAAWDALVASEIRGGAAVAHPLWRAPR